MSALDPSNMTMQDLCAQALRESGAYGVGQTPLAMDITDAWFRLQTMLQEWNTRRWLVFHLKTLLFTSTGAVT